MPMSLQGLRLQSMAHGFFFSSPLSSLGGLQMCLAINLGAVWGTWLMPVPLTKAPVCIPTE